MEKKQTKMEPKKTVFSMLHKKKNVTPCGCKDGSLHGLWVQAQMPNGVGPT